MSAFELMQMNMLSPPILCFALGIVATWVKSDLRFPEPVYQALSIYLLFAIGLKGGMALNMDEMGNIWLVLLAAVALSALIPLWCIPLLQRLMRFQAVDAAAIAAHYASVSVVTFLAASAFLTAINEPHEGFLPAVVAVMEVPGIIVALLWVQRGNANAAGWGSAVKSVLVGKSVYLLLGGLLIGMVSTPQGLAQIEPFFISPFKGLLCLFLIEMGIVASRRFSDLPKVGLPLLIFAVVMPVLHATLGIWVGYWVGLSRGGAFILGTLAASASYIAAPATIRLALPQANPAYYLTSALALTFPFNLTLGIPLYYAIASYAY